MRILHFRPQGGEECHENDLPDISSRHHFPLVYPFETRESDRYNGHLVVTKRPEVVAGYLERMLNPTTSYLPAIGPASRGSPDKTSRGLTLAVRLLVYKNFGNKK